MQDAHAWSGRFSEPVSELVKKYTASVDFDKRMAAFDIQGSLAHAAMLTRAGVLSEADLSAIEAGMAEILQDIQEGRFEWSVDLEDVHMNVEKRLTDKIGDAGKRLHTGRRRNIGQCDTGVTAGRFNQLNACFQYTAFFGIPNHIGTNSAFYAKARVA